MGQSWGFPKGTESTAPAELYESPRWYACYTRARHEKRVAAALHERGIDSYLPLHARVQQWKDRKKRVQFPLFPGYVFGHFTLQQLHPVLTTPGVSTIIRVNGYPTPIPEREIENVRRFEAALEMTGQEAEPVPYMEIGTRIRIVDGAFEGVEGVVVERRGRQRVLVGFEAIGQGLEVDIAAHLLEPLEAPA